MPLISEVQYQPCALKEFDSLLLTANLVVAETSRIYWQLIARHLKMVEMPKNVFGLSLNFPVFYFLSNERDHLHAQRRQHDIAVRILLVLRDGLRENGSRVRANAFQELTQPNKLLCVLVELNRVQGTLDIRDEFIHSELK